MINLYTVMFSTGEYEDHYEQTLVAFLTREEADAHVLELKEAYSDWNDETEDGGQNCWTDDYCDNKPYELHIEYNGPSFYIGIIDVDSNIVEDLLKQNCPELFI